MSQRLLRSVLPALIAGTLLLTACGHDGGARGPYLGQTPPEPGGEARLFAPGIVSSGLHTRDFTMTPDGREIYFCVILGNFDYSSILVTRQADDGSWSEPSVLPLAANPAWKDLEPHVSPDGLRLYFMSDRPNLAAGETEPDDTDIWVADRAGAGWGEPRNLGAPVNSDAAEYFPSTTRDGTLYFTREDPTTRMGGIFRSRLLESGEYGQPEKLGEAVNSTPNVFNAFVDPDERWLIVPTFGREDSFGRTDYYVCFPDPDEEGGWTGPFNLGDRVNTAGGQEFSAAVSPDGRWLFFMAARAGEELFGEEGMTLPGIWRAFGSPLNGSPNIYWIDAEVIEGARPAP